MRYLFGNLVCEWGVGVDGVIVGVGGRFCGFYWGGCVLGCFVYWLLYSVCVWFLVYFVVLLGFSVRGCWFIELGFMYDYKFVVGLGVFVGWVIRVFWVIIVFGGVGDVCLDYWDCVLED